MPRRISVHTGGQQTRTPDGGVIIHAVPSAPERKVRQTDILSGANHGAIREHDVDQTVADADILGETDGDADR